MTKIDLQISEALELSVEDAIAACDGDLRAALRAALIANSFLVEEVERLTHAVSFGFIRGRISAARSASEKLDDWRTISWGAALKDEKSTRRDPNTRPADSCAHGS